MKRLGNITVHYARRVKAGQSGGSQVTHIPLRLNQAGVIPIIFAISLVLLPSLAAQLLEKVGNPQVVLVARNVAAFMDPKQNCLQSDLLYTCRGFYLFLYCSGLQSRENCRRNEKNMVDLYQALDQVRRPPAI